jgi:hypothetical protein
MYTTIIGCDSETVQDGSPFTFQFFGNNVNIIKWIDAKQATKEFLTICDQLMDSTQQTLGSKSRVRKQVVLYAHHLQFDIVSFFHDRWHKLAESAASEYTFSQQGWKITIIWGPPCFAKMQKGRATVWLIDTGAFFKGTLKSLAEIFCPKLPKLSMPPRLGKHRYTNKDKRFVAYAMRDAEIAFHIGTQIDNLAAEYDLQQCVSAPHMAGRIFKHHFMQRMIPLPQKKIIYASMRAYHGGKNNVTQTGWHTGIRCLDISSAYPYAMAQFPSFSDERLYQELQGGKVSQVPQYGIYCITGKVKKCVYPVIFDHRFQPIFGSIKNIWVTGFEINEALRSKELEVERIHGYFYQAEKDKYYSPFKGYVQKFYSLKQKEKDKSKREFWKLLQNSLYGKFIQTKRKGSRLSTWDVDLNKAISDLQWTAGGLFNPFIAALITGHTRAYIHRLEHKYKALHTATDGIITKARPRMNGKVKLGGLGLEAKGDALIFRNKLYIIYSNKPASKRSLRSKVFKGKWIIKYAKHGFNGDVFALEKMAITGNYRYNYTKANTLKDSYRRGRNVNAFDERKGYLQLEI